MGNFPRNGREKNEEIIMENAVRDVVHAFVVRQSRTVTNTAGRTRATSYSVRQSHRCGISLTFYDATTGR